MYVILTDSLLFDICTHIKERLNGKCRRICVFFELLPKTGIMICCVPGILCSFWCVVRIPLKIFVVSMGLQR